MHAPNAAVSELMQALHRFLGENDLMVCLTMMNTCRRTMNQFPFSATEKI